MDAMDSMDDVEEKNSSAGEEETEDEQPKVDKRKSSVPRRTKKAPQPTKVLVNGKMKKPHRFRPGTVALREITKYQKSTDLLIPRQTTRRLIRELANERKPGTRLTHSAYESLHSVAEEFLTRLLHSGMDMAVYAGRTTLELKDLRKAIDQSGLELSREFIENAKRIRKIN